MWGCRSRAVKRDSEQSTPTHTQMCCGSCSGAFSPLTPRDATADAFLVAWRRLGDAPKKPDDVRAWLFGIARNCLLNTLRSQGRRDALAVRVIETTHSAGLADGLDTDFLARRIDLAAAWRRLRKTEQEALSLTVFESLTSPQAARVLGITPVSYRLRLMRARRALQRQLELDKPTPYVPMEAQ